MASVPAPDMVALYAALAALDAQRGHITLTLVSVAPVPPQTRDGQRPAGTITFAGGVTADVYVVKEPKQ
ncbi:MAG: hypothetical protein OHK0022_27690 [Roseiflexaceae bacterium]